MNTSSAARRRRHLPSSPFKPRPEPEIEVFTVGDRVIHDKYGLGRVIGTEDAAVAVDFGSETVRLTSPFSRLTKL